MNLLWTVWTPLVMPYLGSTPVTPYRIGGAGMENGFRFVDFCWCLRLMMDKGVTSVVVTGEELGANAATEIAIGAGGVDIK